jgi:hypothetical protein
MTNTRLWGDTREVDIESWTGNAGPNKTTKYSKYILAFWPKQFEFEVFIKINKNYANEILNKSIGTNFHDKIAQDNFKNLINKFINMSEEVVLSVDVIEKIYNMLDMIKDIPLLTSFTSKIKLKNKHIVRLVFQYDWDAVKESLKLSIYPSFQKISQNCDLIKVIKISIS